MKQNIYDIKTFSEAYDKMRYENRGKNANDLVEIPNFRKLIPDLNNKRVLDLGCGYGENDIYCRELGAKEVLGIDISEHMLKIAMNNNKDKKIKYKLMAMEDIDKLKEKFDVVISSLAIHYVKNYNKLIKDIYNLLNKAIKEKRKCLIEYYSKNEENISIRTIHPYDLILFGNEWGVAAYCELKEEIRHFYINRIKSIKLLEKFYN